MMPHYPDLGSASDWLKQISHRARPIRSTTQITSMEYLCSFLRHQFVGKPVVVSQNVGCFLRLWFEASGKLFNYLYFMQVLKTMDFHGHRRYHPYTPPVDAHRGLQLGAGCCNVGLLHIGTDWCRLEQHGADW